MASITRCFQLQKMVLIMMIDLKIFLFIQQKTIRLFRNEIGVIKNIGKIQPKYIVKSQN